MDDPIIIELIDSEEKINDFLPKLDELLAEAGALATLEKVKAWHYRAKQKTDLTAAIEES